MLIYSTTKACFEHSNFFTVKYEDLISDNLISNMFPPKMTRDSTSINTMYQSDYSHQKFNYELFNYSNFNIHYWSWNYRGCWHQTCPPIDP